MLRFFDIIFSLIGLIVLGPIILFLTLWILADSKGSAIYKQERVGRNGVIFTLYKFRSMFINSEKKSLITIGNRDNRITRSGYYIRKFKLDELPQLINVLIGDMSFVGPRPEVRKYVDLYNKNQKTILSRRPGITDYASIKFVNENELLAKSINPELTYINEIIPLKIELNMIFLNDPSPKQYFHIILLTIKKIVS